MRILIEIAGWIGMVLILTAYALLTMGKLEPRSTAYHVINIVGAIGFIINSGWNGAIPSAALNVIWLGIGIFGLLRMRGKGGRPGTP
jgi:hypothetical protein